MDRAHGRAATLHLWLALPATNNLKYLNRTKTLLMSHGMSHDSESCIPVHVLEYGTRV